MADKSFSSSLKCQYLCLNRTLSRRNNGMNERERERESMCKRSFRENEKMRERESERE